ncbi:sulfotransferase domain-containing protein [uncultured Desulfobacter sp.]|uniref:sulfotransferase domain-containing protein n=1 Tax=uncultured Desulfobacter sp. TaxID=240139 RepID=UPI002AA87C0D|nr:sulfotransferase domain-containing protein [uncultured Desulfobacter sp.]
MQKLPNFLHIGLSKAASTWIQNIFRKEKELFFVYKTNFFFPLSSKNYEKGIEWYSDHFKNASKKQIIIESQEHIILPIIHPELKCACTNLKSVELIANRIKKYIPDIKIILIVRNQVDMLLSRYTQYVLQGGKLGPSSFFDKLVFKNDSWVKNVDYRYSIIIDILYSVFDKSNVLILLQEDLKHNRKRFLDDLSKYLQHDLSPYYDKDKKSANVAPSYWGIQLIRFLNILLVKHIETIESKTQTKAPYKVWLFLKNIIRILDNFLIRKKQKRKLLKHDQVERIRQIFSSDNKKLSKLFGKKINKYCYYY